MTEMKKLIAMLKEAEIPFELTEDVCRNPANQVWYPSHEEPVCDVICLEFSYGGTEGLLEIMGLVDDDFNDIGVEGYLTADEVFHRIKRHYES